MKGKHHIVIETDRLKYEFDIRRNITVVQGDSATGKTTLINILQDYARRGAASGVRMQSDVPCIVCSAENEIWRMFLETVHHSIVFFDEDCRFVTSTDFASAIRNTDNYYVLVTRQSLRNLPYSIEEIYGIRTSGRFHFPEQIYHEFYPIYRQNISDTQGSNTVLLIEDSVSGFQFFRKACNGSIECVSAEGNGNVDSALDQLPHDCRTVVIADGAAFGAYIRNVVMTAEGRGNTALYFPESFEWMVLRSGVIPDSEIEDILSEPERYIESRDFFSWERYFTELLESATDSDPVRHYRKTKLTEYYTTESVKSRILSVLPKEIQDIIL